MFFHLEIHVNFAFYSMYYLSILYKFKVLNYAQVESLNSSSTLPHSPNLLRNSKAMPSVYLVTLNSPENNWVP